MKKVIAFVLVGIIVLSLSVAPAFAAGRGRGPGDGTGTGVCVNPEDCVVEGRGPNTNSDWNRGYNAEQERPYGGNRPDGERPFSDGECPYDGECPNGGECLNDGTCINDGICQNDGVCQNPDSGMRRGFSRFKLTY